MRYLGGKTRIAKPLAAYIVEEMRLNGLNAYWEPFCGSCAVACEVAKLSPKTPMLLSDAHPDLMLMWQALQKGWMPPEEVSESDYATYRNAESNAMRGFVGFGSSYGGKWWGGYARNGDTGNRAPSTAGESSRSLRRAAQILSKASFRCCDYSEVPAMEAMIYCDPPYAETTHYKTGVFDSTVFWAWVREMSKRNVVLVSEYVAPDDFECVWARERNLEMRSKIEGERRKEKLFKLLVDKRC